MHTGRREVAAASKVTTGITHDQHTAGFQLPQRITQGSGVGLRAATGCTGFGKDYATDALSGVIECQFVDRGQIGRADLLLHISYHHVDITYRRRHHAVATPVGTGTGAALAAVTQRDSDTQAQITVGATHVVMLPLGAKTQTTARLEAVYRHVPLRTHSGPADTLGTGTVEFVVTGKQGDILIGNRQVVAQFDIVPLERQLLALQLHNLAALADKGQVGIDNLQLGLAIAITGLLGDTAYIRGAAAGRLVAVDARTVTGALHFEAQGGLAKGVASTAAQGVVIAVGTQQQVIAGTPAETQTEVVFTGLVIIGTPADIGKEQAVGALSQRQHGANRAYIALITEFDFTVEMRGPEGQTLVYAGEIERSIGGLGSGAGPDQSQQPIGLE